MSGKTSSLPWPGRRGLLAATISGFAASIARAEADAGWAANKTVTIIIPYAPGGGSDVVGRILSEGLTRRMDGTFVTDYRPGASTSLAARYVARARPDGTTLLLGSGSTFTLVPHVLRNVGYDPLADFAHVTQLTEATLIFVAHPRWASLPALIDAAKARPGLLSAGSWGVGSVAHLETVDFMHRTGTEVLHVPYNGPTGALTDLIAGRLDFMVTTAAPALPHIESGKLRLLGIVAPSRLDVLPNVPTLAEQGLDMRSIATWWCLSAPAGTPEPIVAALNDAVGAVLDEPANVALLRNQFNSPVRRGPAAMRTRIQEEFHSTGALVRAAGLLSE